MGVNYLGKHGLSLASKPKIRNYAIKKALKSAEQGYQNNLEQGRFSPGECEDRYVINKAIIESADRLVVHPNYWTEVK